MTFTTKVVLFLVGFATSILLARGIGPQGKGIFSLVVLAAAVVFNSTNLGIGTGSGYFLGRRKVPRELITGSWLSLSLMIGSAALVLAILLAPHLVPRYMPSVPLVFVYVALVTVPFQVLIFNLQSLFKAGNDFKRFNLVELSHPVLFLLLVLVFYYAFPRNKLVFTVASFSASYVAGGLLAVVLVRGVTKLRLRWDWKLARSATSFGVQGFFANFLGFLNLRLDLLLVNFFLSPAHVGYYSISVMMAEKIWYVPDVFSVVLYPRVAHGAEEQANRDTGIVSRQTVLIVTAGCLLVFAVGRFIIRILFTDAFLPAVAPLFVLLPGILARGIARVVSSDLLARGYPRVILWSGFVALIANLVLNIIFIPRLGVSGAALATTVSYTLNALVIVVAFIRITGVPIRAILAPTRADAQLTIEGIRRILSSRRGIRS